MREKLHGRTHSDGPYTKVDTTRFGNDAHAVREPLDVRDAQLNDVRQCNDITTAFEKTLSPTRSKRHPTKSAIGQGFGLTMIRFVW